ncbi:TMV resistance protein N-like [Coffea arabica]|uniref:ADP-ribosyl cyclase/cyclic ADP-ribose hydrolase n=1 Tax=Coffea arabica TaxID=13443 RepID=A0ABM4VL52_COFAR
MDSRSFVEHEMRNIASSYSSSSKWTYDVFLSFRGEDVRKGIVDHLYSALEQKGIHTFKDDEKLERGRSISPTLLQAIKESRIAVIIFSENYATSSWCLDELAEIIDCKHVLGQTVLPVFYYVDPSVVRRQKGSFDRAFVKHEDEIEDKERIQKWRAALTEAASISGWDVPKTADGHESKCIQEIVEYVVTKLERVVAIEAKNQVGIDSRVQRVNALLNLGSGKVQFIGIWGMSGIGKTTIAWAVFNRISTHFEGAIFLEDVRKQSESLKNLQEEILSKILCLKDLRISSVLEGSKMIQTRLCCKKVLIVLDDVDHLSQLEALAGMHEWFGDGSRIIITTKNKHLLVTHGVDKMHKMKVLNEYEANQLFSWHAFKKDYPAKDYEELSIEIVHYAGCLPLALKVLGSFLYGREMAEWRSEVERLKRIPEDEIMEKLKVSFNGLKEVEKEIFLDIACFFEGKKKDYIRRVLDSFNFCPDIHINVLIQKSLITLSRGRILMHCLIQEMGWNIVREKAPDEPGKHSRLWVAEEICDVLARDKATENIVGMWLDLPSPQDVVIKNEAFEKMKKLRLLKINNACVSCCPNCIPNEIRWLNWHGYPSKSLPESFQPEKLVGLKLQYSRVIQLWKGIKLLDKLKYMNLSYSQKLIRTPDFTGIPNLKRLILEGCSSLTEIHPSAGYLKRLQKFNLRNCTNLRSLPKKIIWESLEVMILSGCSKVGEFPEILGTMDHLKAVYLEATAIKELPPSIEHLTSLVLLNLSYCESLTSLPSGLCRLKCLEALVLSGCSKLDRLPEELGHVLSLEELYVDETAISEPPSSIVLLKNLKTLSFRGCKAMASRKCRASLPSWLLGQKSQDSTGLVFPSVSGLNSLAKLDLSDCNLSDKGLPCDLGSLSLVELNLGKNNFTSISAANIKNLSRLRILELVGCKRLEILPELPPCIEEVYADNCTSLQSATDLTKHGLLHRISFSNCFKLLQDERTSSMIYATWNHMLKEFSLRNGSFSICLPGGSIPSWFTHQNSGPSITIELPPNWYNNEFMGFAVCVVSDLIRTPFLLELLQKIPGFPVQFTLIDKEMNLFCYVFTMAFVGAENNIGSEHTCLGYLPFHYILDVHAWSIERKRSLWANSVRSPNDWTCIEASAHVDVKECLVFKEWGISLVYKNDVRQNS